MNQSQALTARTITAVLTLSIATIALAAEKTVARTDLPKPVEATLIANLNGATVKSVTTEREHGNQTYEVETQLNGHTRDIEIAADGTLNEIEEEVAFDSLSSAVQSALTIRAHGATITKVETLT